MLTESIICKRVSPEPAGVGLEVGWEIGDEPAPAPDAGVPVDARTPWSQATWAGVKGGVPTGVLVGSVIALH